MISIDRCRSGGPLRGVDGTVLAFFAIAAVLAWGVWLFLGHLAAGSRLDTAAYIGAIERWDTDRIAGSLPMPVLYGLTRLVDFSFTVAGVVMIAAPRVGPGSGGWPVSSPLGGYHSAGTRWPQRPSPCTDLPP